MQNKLLIVDDDADILELLGNYFVKENYKVDFANNGKQMSKIKGFTKGCDVYVVKPFDLAELSFRIQAVQKRIIKENNSSCETVILVKDIRINTEEHTVYKSENIIELTPKEYDILCLLATNKGRVYSTKMIYEMIWKDSFMENDNSVITHIRNLREKIGDNAKNGTYIKTIWGVGYKIEKED